MTRLLVLAVGAALLGLLAWQVASALAEPLVLDESRPAIVQQRRSDGLLLTLALVSAQAGPNVVRVQVAGRNGGAVPVERLTLYPTMPGHDMLLLSPTVETERTPTGDFRAETAAFEMFGTWDITVEAAGPAGTETTTFQVQIAPSKPQVVLFAGVPLALLGLGLAAVIVVWRRSTGRPGQPAAAERVGAGA